MRFLNKHKIAEVKKQKDKNFINGQGKGSGAIKLKSLEISIWLPIIPAICNPVSSNG